MIWLTKKQCLCLWFSSLGLISVSEFQCFVLSRFSQQLFCTCLKRRCFFPLFSLFHHCYRLPRLHTLITDVVVRLLGWFICICLLCPVLTVEKWAVFKLKSRSEIVSGSSSKCVANHTGRQVLFSHVGLCFLCFLLFDFGRLLSRVKRKKLFLVCFLFFLLERGEGENNTTVHWSCVQQLFWQLFLEIDEHFFYRRKYRRNCSLPNFLRPPLFCSSLVTEKNWIFNYSPFFGITKSVRGL